MDSTTTSWSSSRSHCPSFVVGLTGGIASGKTLVSENFSRLGVTVIDTDIIARQLVAAGQPLLLQIVQQFGERLLLDNGELDRAALRERVFHHAPDRFALEAIMHPAIRTRSMDLLRSALLPYTILVVPLLFESKTPYPIDRILVVDTTVENQVARAFERDGSREDTIRGIIAAQTDRHVRRERADDVIDNNGDVAALYAKVQVLHQYHLQLARQRSLKTNPE